MRRRQLKRLWARLHQLKGMVLTRDELLLKLGAAKQQSPSAWRLVKIDIPQKDEALQFSLRRDKLRTVRRREGRYLLRTTPDFDSKGGFFQKNINDIKESVREISKV
jgi:hypothetical protein